MGDGVLYDQGLDAIRVSERHSKADRSAVILHVEGVVGQLQRFGARAGNAILPLLPVHCSVLVSDAGLFRCTACVGLAAMERTYD